MATIGRNYPCYCGSGQKYKRCHGKASAPRDTRAVPAINPKLLDLLVRRQQARQQEVQKQFGLGRPPISVEFAGHKIVAVGSEIHWSKNWKTFPDFLMTYFKNVMGAPWGTAQLARPRADWHPLFLWYAMACEYQKETIPVPGQIACAPMTGAACGVLWLTYGLYLLRHNAEVQNRLLQRLRTDDPVQIFGAIYEVLIASAMIRAGFDLELEDETDGSVTHCEFTATSKKTGKRFSVEVKVCDPGNIAGAVNRNRVQRQLVGALSKQANHPRIVCIELNRPWEVDNSPEKMKQLLQYEIGRLHKQEGSLQINGAAAPPAYVLLSNFPFRFSPSGTYFPRAAILEGFKIPGLVANAPFPSLRALAEFEDEHSDAFDFGRAYAEMHIPQTLDGDLPSRAFGGPGEPILIGERYAVKDGDGNDTAGELLSAIVDETGKQATAVLRLDEGSTIIVNMPLSDEDLAIYRDSPDTFFGVNEPQVKPETAVELYRWILSVYRNTPREKLLEFMKGHADIARYSGLPQDELAKVYAEGIAQAMRQKTEARPSKRGTNP